MPVLYWQGYGFLGVGKNFIINVDPIEFQDGFHGEPCGP